MSSSLSSAANNNSSQQSGSSRYKFSQNSQNKPRYSQHSNSRHGKNYAQVAQNPAHSGITYAAAPKSQNVLNHIEHSTNLAKMDLKMSKMIKNQVNQGIYRNSKFVMASNTVIGCPVLLKVKSNDTFHGIFVTYSPDFDVLLECCHKVDPDNEVVIYGRSLPKPSQVHARFFERENIVEMTAFEVDKEFALKTAENNFLDSAIAAKVNQKPTNEDTNSDQCKELEPFPFDEDHSASSTNHLDLEAGAESTQPSDMDLKSNSGWNAEDMLMTNQQKYGYKSTYNSSLLEYTIPVEREDSDEYRRREEAAEKLAAEIESSATYRRNIDKELSDNEEEEEAFSAVVRTEINNNSSTNNNNNNNNTTLKDSYQKNDKQIRRPYTANKPNQRPSLPANKRAFIPQNNKADRHPSINNSYKKTMPDQKADTKKYAQQKYSGARQHQAPSAPPTGPILYSAVVTSCNQDQSFSSQVSYSSKVSSKQDKSSASPSQPAAESASSISSSTSNTPNKSLNTSHSQPAEPAPTEPQQPEADEPKSKLNPNAVEFNPTFISQSSPSPGLMANQPIQIVVAPGPPPQFNYDAYPAPPIHPPYAPNQPPLIYQQPQLLPHQQAQQQQQPQHQSTQILINQSGAIPLPQFIVMNPGVQTPSAGANKPRKSDANPRPSLVYGQQLVQQQQQQQGAPAQPYAYPSGYQSVRMAPPFYPLDQQGQGSNPVYYQYANQMVHPQVQQGFQYVMSPQSGQAQQQQQQQQPPPPSSTPSNVQSNHSAPHTPSPMPSVQQAAQQMQQMQIGYPAQGYASFVPQGYPGAQSYGYQVAGSAYPPGQMMYVQQAPGNPFHYQNRSYYMNSNSSTNLQANQQTNSSTHN